MKHIEAYTCPLCDSANIAESIRIDELPAHCNVLYPTREKALSVTKSAVHLFFCRDCAHIFNATFRQDLMTYGRNYENSLEHSPTFRSYLESQAARLVSDYGLQKKSIVEIGCGNGSFLQMLCKLGANHGVGFDVGACAASEEEGIAFVQDCYSEAYWDYRGDLFCCRQTLEHIERPVEFLTMLRRIIGRDRNTVIFFEVPNASYMIRHACIWDIIHEHCSYYCANSLKLAFLRSGYDVTPIRETYGGQFLCIDAKPSRQETPNRDESGEVRNTKVIEQFAEAYHVRILEWQQRLKEFSARRLRAVLWGAGSKGITFLNMLKVNGQIEYAVDVNPRKRGMYVPGTGHPIVAPGSRLRELPPDVVIVMNSIYVEEIRQTLGRFGLQPQILVA